jgi:sugar/nucleoside kinase (ribokinase family)
VPEPGSTRSAGSDLNEPPSARRGEVVCIGHAIVDRLAHVEEATVIASGVEPGSMTLVDGNQISKIVELVPDWVQVAGGSAANTAAGLASLGDRPSFVGSVGTDALGEGYERDLAGHGVRCVLGRDSEGRATGQCLVLVTEDSGRTMATNLGAGVVIDVAAVERAEVAESAAVYLEGYLLDSPGTFSAMERAIDLARRSGALVAVSLSDPFLVERHGEALKALVEGGVDLLFANEEEARRFTGASELEEALERLERPGLVAAVTLGPEGAVLVDRGERARVKAWSVGPVDDTTGAGDLFAAGVLHGLVHGAPLEVAGRLGALAAAEIVSHLGAQPQESLRSLAAKTGLAGPY